ncbi:hypothetical protein AYO22_00889 [Fonsecaea multimorphosa]|nr:hypothetical protein AYO22_00889 [Fonsecaea multimorphosa]
MYKRIIEDASDTEYSRSYTVKSEESSPTYTQAMSGVPLSQKLGSSHTKFFASAKAFRNYLHRQEEDPAHHHATYTLYAANQGRWEEVATFLLDNIYDDQHPLLTDGEALSPLYQLLLNNRYFERRWVIQEPLLASSVTLCCEGYMLPLSLLRDARGKWESRFAASPMRRFLQARRTGVDTHMSLADLLYTHETAECSEARDKVYAILSLSKAAKDHLVVDYDRDIVEVLTDVVGVSLEHEDMPPTQALSFACFLRHHLRIKKSQILTFSTPVNSMQNWKIRLQAVV